MFALPRGMKFSAAVLALGLALTGCATDGYGGYGSVSVGTGWDDGYYGPGYYGPGYYGPGYYGYGHPGYYGYPRGYAIPPRYRDRDRHHDHRRWREGRAASQPPIRARPSVVQRSQPGIERWQSRREPVEKGGENVRRHWQRDRR